MTNKVTITSKTDPAGKIDTTPSYLKAMEERFRKWTGIEEAELSEALKDVSGDLWGEIRKFEAQTCREIEKRDYDDDFKELIKARIRDMWRDIVEHQKIGIDKLAIVIRGCIDENKKSDNKD